MTELMQASHQWASRPDDERYTSLHAMRDFFIEQRDNSREMVVSARTMNALPQNDHKGMLIEIPKKVSAPCAPTNWAFGQTCSLVGAPASYLRTLPAEVAADCLNYGLNFNRKNEEIGTLVHRNGDGVYTMKAATGPRYGRIWNSDICGALVQHFGDGVTGEWKVPGEFGKDVAITKANTTLFAGDRDMFVFLADEKNRVTLPNRRSGRSGTLARGFFVWNSEVGDTTFGLGTFLFDYACCNRIVWGAEGYTEIKIRHTVSAPDKWLDEIEPALETYRKSSDSNIVQAIEDARADKLGDKLDDFLNNRFSRKAVATMKEVHMLEEQRPIETRWDVVTAATAYARAIQWQDQRVAVEREAGALLKMAA